MHLVQTYNARCVREQCEWCVPACTQHVSYVQAQARELESECMCTWCNAQCTVCRSSRSSLFTELFVTTASRSSLRQLEAAV